MANSKFIRFGGENSGIIITYVKRRKILQVWGWYDHYVGIEGGEISLDYFLEKLGIKTLVTRKTKHLP